ncbi:integrase core domain-containing protein [Nonomuraea sp. NPDC049486]|uniref:integrase core domain-containing protein n=1 Tax=Nonomuraea sp. NPDC049486 TaxID=3155773 RepID=UPI00343318D4
MRRELLTEALPFASLEAAQPEVDAFAEHYNTARPHQALDMALPTDRFFIERSDGLRRAERELPLHLPAGLTTVTAPALGAPLQLVLLPRPPIPRFLPPISPNGPNPS